MKGFLVCWCEDVHFIPYFLPTVNRVEPEDVRMRLASVGREGSDSLTVGLMDSLDSATHRLVVSLPPSSPSSPSLPLSLPFPLSLSLSPSPLLSVSLCLSVNLCLSICHKCFVSTSGSFLGGEGAVFVRSYVYVSAPEDTNCYLFRYNSTFCVSTIIMLFLRTPLIFSHSLLFRFAHLPVPASSQTDARAISRQRLSHRLDEMTDQLNVIDQISQNMEREFQSSAVVRSIVLFG